MDDRMKVALSRAGVAMALLVGGCFASGGCSFRAVTQTSTSCLDACRGALSDAQLSAQVAIWSDLQASFSGAVEGDKALASAASTLTGFIQAMVSGNAGAPGGFSYQGNGVLSASPTTDARVDVRFYLATATSYGKVGDPITFDVFDPASYFQGLSVSTGISASLSGIQTYTHFDFTKAGPGAELLGLGASPSSPLSIDVGQLSSKLGALDVAATTAISHADGPTVITLQVTTAPRSASSVSGTMIPLMLQGFTGSRSDTAQALSLDTALLASVSGGAALDGTSLLRSTSPGFSFQMLFHFPASALADVAFGCPGVTLAAP
jgi:hypothetical protein